MDLSTHSDLGNERSASAPLPTRGSSDLASQGNIAKLDERSAVVLALFGPSVGHCVGDYSTTYFRANGRLYAASQAILFYSNLFGFERRLCLRFSDIERVESYRSTSIKISMVDCEDHIFRKFTNRERVLQVLNDLFTKARGAMKHIPVLSDLAEEPVETTMHETHHHSRSPTPDELNVSAHGVPSRQRLTSDPSEIGEGLATTTTRHLRQRSFSLPSMESVEALPQAQLVTQNISPSKRRRVFRRARTAIGNGRSTSSHTNSTADFPPTTESDPPGSQQVSSPSLLVSSPSAPADFDMQSAWEEAKMPYEEVALETITLQCSLEGFMDLFFSNDASFPISKYQQEIIKDQNLSYSKWKKSASAFPPTFDRRISFIHPLNNTIGPSEAKTSRTQQFQRFGPLGATLQSTTHIQGVPGADCFKMQDRWVVEAISESSVRFSVSFQITFFKRTMLKAIISKNIKLETKKWFLGYLKFVKRALQEDDGKIAPPSPNATTSNVDSLETKLPLYIQDGKRSVTLTIVSAVLLMVLLAIAVQMFYLQQSIAILHHQMALMRQENLELRSALQQVSASHA